MSSTRLYWSHLDDWYFDMSRDEWLNVIGDVWGERRSQMLRWTRKWTQDARKKFALGLHDEHVELYWERKGACTRLEEALQEISEYMGPRYGLAPRGSEPYRWIPPRGWECH